MGVSLNYAVFNEADDSMAVTEVTVTRVSNGDIGIILKVSDADSNEKLFATLAGLGIDAKYGKSPHTQQHINWFVTLSVDVIAAALVKLKDEKLLSQRLFADVCVNFPAQVENFIDRRLATIVGIEPAPLTELEVLVDPSRGLRSKYLGEHFHILESFKVLAERLQIAPELPLTKVRKPECINYDTVARLHSADRPIGSASRFFDQTKQLSARESVNPDPIVTPEFNDESGQHLAGSEI